MTVFQPHTGDFTDDHWLLLVEDDGYDGLGRVIGYLVFDSEGAAEEHDNILDLCERLGLFEGEKIPEDVVTEIITYREFRQFYGNRMPLVNRGLR